jgi:hypothetical protein
MNFADVAKQIATAVGNFAPGIATVLAATGVGAPAAAAVAAIGSLAKSLGLPDTATQNDVLAAIQSTTDPDMKLKMIQAENDFQLKQKDQEIQIINSQLKDVQGARDMHTAHESKVGEDYNLYILSWVIVIGFFAVVALLLFVTIPAGATNVLYTLLGTLAAGFMLVLQFFYGTNRSSDAKTDMIFNSVPIEKK